MKDHFGRTIEYLRLAITEACNFRCVYCAPEGHARLSASPLTLPEIEQLVRAAVSLGIDKIRLTGGEPLVRREVVDIVRTIAALGVQDLALTTNGMRLAELARPLAEAGLRRVNISLDTLQRERFARIVCQDAFDRVWQGILAAEAAGLVPLKLNVVALRGVNDDELEAFAQLTREHPWHVRFIELMPVGTSDRARQLFQEHFIAAHELRARLAELEPISGPTGNGPARTYRLPNAQGTIGFITPASEHFCATCNRIRVTSQGVVHPCLFGGEELNLRPLLHDAQAERAVREALRSRIAAKPERHPLGAQFTLLEQAMSQIGG